MKRHHFIPVGLIVAGFSAAGLALGEEEPERVLPDVLVEAVRDSIVPAHYAGSATIIEAEEIKNAGVRSVAELLASKGGVPLTTTSGNLSDAQVHLRGFGENSNLRVLLMVDGQPVNRPDMGGISWLEVPVSQIERVEILRGPQTALYGNHAVGGVIHIVTRQGTSVPSASIEIAGGSDGLLIGRGSFRGSYDGNDLSFDLERNYTDGWRDNAASEVDSFGVRWKREIFPGTVARLGVSYADEYGEFPGPLGKTQYLTDPRQSIYAAAGQGNQYFNEQGTFRTEGSILLGKGGDWTFEVPVSTLRRDQSWNFGPGSHADNLLQTISLTPVLKRAGETWSAEAGLTYRHDELDITKFAEIQRLHQTGQALLLRDVGGAFTKAEWEYRPGWHLSGALRWEAAELEGASRDFMFPSDPLLNFSRDHREDNWAARAGLKWEPDKDRSAWLRYDKIYRLPATDEIAAYQGYPLQVPFNDALHAETGHGVEIGGEWKPGGWTLGATAFAQWLEGEILYDYTQNLNVNLADTRRVGVELNGGYQSSFWDVDVRYTCLKAEFADGHYEGREVYLVPRQHVSATVAMHPHVDWTVQAEWQATSSCFEGNDFLNTGEKLPAYQVTNLMIRYEPKPGLSLYARVNNLFDERYATLKYSGVWYPAAGRQFQIGIRREL
ncbi:TonB-dependent receptor [Luteolibacter ambystomatis]|uniref:TonB-dependent receptor n=1 Tax=Luteolibacter ambystomatis TaxID=2824561 RepID=A0A975G8Z5_9BACT|nr:TonB-dependent receptor [Luteolibacter ambystomatis]QUE51022.1 TonB-dependent receptor [Luteolibacter ambystomatis]